MRGSARYKALVRINSKRRTPLCAATKLILGDKGTNATWKMAWKVSFKALARADRGWLYRAVQKEDQRENIARRVAEIARLLFSAQICTYVHRRNCSCNTQTRYYYYLKIALTFYILRSRISLSLSNFLKNWSHIAGCLFWPCSFFVFNQFDVLSYKIMSRSRLLILRDRKITNEFSTVARPRQILDGAREAKGELSHTTSSRSPAFLFYLISS